MAFVAIIPVQLERLKSWNPGKEVPTIFQERGGENLRYTSDIRYGNNDINLCVY